MFVELAVIILIAAFFGFVAEKFRLPTLLGYIVAGVLVSFGLEIVGIDHSLNGVLKDWGSIGVVLLLFLVGMEMSAPRVKKVGKAAVLVGLGQILFTVLVGMVLTKLMGYGWFEGMYIATALAFSSTVVVVKLLSERGDLHSLHGRITVGFLLVQDLAAIVMLVLLSSTDKGGMDLLVGLEIVFKIVFAIGLVWYLSTNLVPMIMSRLVMSSEILFLSSVAWSLGIAALMTWEPIGFTPEAGGFLAGVTLANTLQHYEIFSRLRPMRDFFVMIFFVYLAIELMNGWTGVNIPEVLVFSIFVLIGNPLIVILLMKLLGYRARTGFMVSLAVAQISEFSLILMAMGVSLGHVNDNSLRVMALVGAITFAISSILITNSTKLWKIFGKYLKRLESKRMNKILGDEKSASNHVVLIGCHRMGRMILTHLKTIGEKVVIIDYNPEVVEALAREGNDVVLADSEDFEVYDLVNMKNAKAVISTVPDRITSLGILEYMNANKSNQAVVILSASIHSEAQVLYEKGADYVNMSRMIGGWHAVEVLEKSDFNKENLRNKGLKELNWMVKVM